MTDASQRKRAVILMVVCAAMWSMGGIFIKLVPWNAIAIAGSRSLFAGLVVFLYMRMQKMTFRPSRPAVISGCFMAALFLCFVMANKLTTAANAIVLQFTSPVFILLISTLFYHKKCRKGDLLVVLATLAGISMFFFDQLTPGGMLGNCVAILAGMLLAWAYLIVGDVDEETRMSGILLGHWIAAFVSIPFFFQGTTPVTPTAAGCILILGIFQLGIPFVLFGISMKHCSALACNLIGAIEPLLNPIWVFLFAGEAPRFYALVGGSIVIAAITIWCIYDSRSGGQAVADTVEVQGGEADNPEFHEEAR